MYKVCKKCGGIFMANNDRVTCAKCNGELELINTNMPMKDIFILGDISKDFNFIKAMMELYDKDPIEYQLKMSQFKSQLGQQDSSNVPKCPTCGSTNLSKVSATSKAGSVALFGIFAMGKVSKQWHCNDCKSEW